MFLEIENLKVRKISERENRGVYSFEPLPQGFGSTLGNSLRRVLLTSIKGAAVTQAKISGVNHQFATIEGVKEDVTQITLNLKRLRFKIFTDNPVVATIDKKGPGVIKASDIEVSSDAEIMNKDLHIATLANNKATFKAELIIEAGIGYSPMEERQTVKLGVIVLDALYSPIVSSSYEVEPTRFGKRTDLDKVVLTIETDGSITPMDAVKEASEILQKYYATIAMGESLIEEIVTQKGPIKSANVENIAVEELPLQTRTVNALKKHGIKTLKEIAEKADDELADIKNLGEKSLSEIRELLQKEGLR
jgi:DNA-directed RNA polymerase subunit alpha